MMYRVRHIMRIEISTAVGRTDYNDIFRVYWLGNLQCLSMIIVNICGSNINYWVWILKCDSSNQQKHNAAIMQDTI